MPKKAKNRSTSTIAMPSISAQNSGENRPRVHVPVDEAVARTAKLGKNVTLVVRGQIRSVEEWGMPGFEGYSLCVEAQEVTVDLPGEIENLMEDEFYP